MAITWYGTTGDDYYDNPTSMEITAYAYGGDDYVWTGSGDDLIYGSGGNDTLKGWYGNDRIYGGTGNDSLDGEADNDTLYGNTGNDILNGGAGADYMYGGAGNDTYYVDVSEEFNVDIIEEFANAGIDLVFSSAYYSGLGDHVENITLIGSAYGANGNSLDNVMTGNSSNNFFWGADGNDSLSGGGGNDTLSGGYNTFSDDEIDTLTGGSGADTFRLGYSVGNYYSNSGNGDYAVITDLWIGDRVQLDLGSYNLGASPISGVSGTAIYEGSELIAIVEGVSEASLEFESDGDVTILKHLGFVIIDPPIFPEPDPIFPPLPPFEPIEPIFEL